MTSFTLGQTPHQMTVVLSPGADFVATLIRSDGEDWPTGTAVDLVIDAGTPLAAVVTGPNVAWDIDSAVLDPIIAGHPKKARLYHTLAGDTVLWALGTVVVK